MQGIPTNDISTRVVSGPSAAEEYANMCVQLGKHIEQQQAEIQRLRDAGNRDGADMWLPIGDAPKVTGPDGRRPLVLLIALYPYSSGTVWSDIVYSWWDKDLGRHGNWARWQHEFPPTHYQPVVPPRIDEVPQP